MSDTDNTIDDVQQENGDQTIEENEDTKTDDTKAESVVDDPELEEMKRRYKEMEEETKKLTELQNSIEASAGAFGDQEEIDARSVYVGNVEYTSTQEEILAHFQSCGTVNRITILNDKTTGHPKGCCYVEFVDKDSVATAIHLNDTMFKDRQIKVTPKRTNLPAYMRYPRGGRGGGGRGRGGRGGPPMGGRGGGGGGGRGAFRGSKRPYHPYS
ncbi:hypothetical protein SAMD00019534_087440 [Acytostelium subglobosum LB1]|uniref:hypothetical protein n=1 Tax=Acytostelium subglobosum LB1 TaxID=1410327 RepID=UPI000644BC56|nr:hypothetical protein SAMD00019534_087440 [Acytostelium subglobosum LB1]GAM25569.1 hypothetical protein SAMD00019534_087440 [Acytostelium subglobosum LB1]|eukprot:XP_012751555.1 hypothetical protein SAMD00019534_087440 [Acytostelium subglobosum LB1]